MEKTLLCINGQKFTHSFIKRKLEKPLNLLSWLKGQKEFPKFYWEDRNKNERAACGCALSIDFVPKFDQENTSPARFYGGHRFFPKLPLKDDLWKDFPSCIFFLPKTEIFCENGTFYILENAIDPSYLMNREFDLKCSEFLKNKTSLNLVDHCPSMKDWKNTIENALKKIQEKKFEKVVFARRSTWLSSTSLCPFEFLDKIGFRGNTKFAIQFVKDSTFIGNTPERLFKREKNRIYTEAVAGTRRRGKTEEEDLALENELYSNPKEIREFSYVKTSIQMSLAPLCDKLICENKDRVIKTQTVQHLYNPYSCDLKEGISDGEILKALHQTAAIGGLPKESALEYIQKHEPFERGWYASPIGYVSQAASEFVVAIRSALVDQNRLHLFAGSGIVSESNPEKEWEELNHKIGQWTNL